MTQAESDYLDLSPFQDVAFWIDVREVSGTTVTLTIQTGPSLDDALFTAMVAGTALSAASVPIVQTAIMTAASVPLARWVRWQLTGSGSPWDTTFRILAAANAPGL
ncbi:MAG TPA: hypothetical protein VK662_15030 [Acidothermaceae bacterium]|nr:hypothetical protein [Acidothermaceae bacterium]